MEIKNLLLFNAQAAVREATTIKNINMNLHGALRESAYRNSLQAKNFKQQAFQNVINAASDAANLGYNIAKSKFTYEANEYNTLYESTKVKTDAHSLINVLASSVDTNIPGDTLEELTINEAAKEKEIEIITNNAKISFLDEQQQLKEKRAELEKNVLENPIADDLRKKEIATLDEQIYNDKELNILFEDYLTNGQNALRSEIKKNYRVQKNWYDTANKIRNEIHSNKPVGQIFDNIYNMRVTAKMKEFARVTLFSRLAQNATDVNGMMTTLGIMNGEDFAKLGVSSDTAAWLKEGYEKLTSDKKFKDSLFDKIKKSSTLTEQEAAALHYEAIAPVVELSKQKADLEDQLEEENAKKRVSDSAKIRQLQQDIGQIDAALKKNKIVMPEKIALKDGIINYGAKSTLFHQRFGWNIVSDIANTTQIDPWIDNFASMQEVLEPQEQVIKVQPFNRASALNLATKVANGNYGNIDMALEHFQEKAISTGIANQVASAIQYDLDDIEENLYNDLNMPSPPSSNQPEPVRAQVIKRREDVEEIVTTTMNYIKLSALSMATQQEVTRITDASGKSGEVVWSLYNSYILSNSKLSIEDRKVSNAEISEYKKIITLFSEANKLSAGKADDVDTKLTTALDDLMIADQRDFDKAQKIRILSKAKIFQRSPDTNYDDAVQYAALMLYPFESMDGAVVDDATILDDWAKKNLNMNKINEFLINQLKRLLPLGHSIGIKRANNGMYNIYGILSNGKILNFERPNNFDDKQYFDLITSRIENMSFMPRSKDFGGYFASKYGIKE